jgi:hypothetical protein
MNLLNPPQFVTRSLIGAVGLSAIALFGAAQSAKAITVVAGSDYWRTIEGSMFNFGGPIGEVEFIGRPIRSWTPPTPEDADPINVGLADTIVRRLDDVNLDSGSGVSRVELVALSLISANYIDLQGSLFKILVDLNPEGDSTGTITIREDQTYSSDFNVSFLPSFRPVSGADIPCVGFLSADACSNFNLPLTANAKWSKEFPGGVKVKGDVGDLNANFHTNLSPDQSDFYSVGIVEHLHKDFANPAHRVKPAPVPEPLTILGSFTAMGFGTFFKRKLGKKLQQEKA